MSWGSEGRSCEVDMAIFYFYSGFSDELLIYSLEETREENLYTTITPTSIQFPSIEHGVVCFGFGLRLFADDLLSFP